MLTKFLLSYFFVLLSQECWVGFQRVNGNATPRSGLAWFMCWVYGELKWPINNIIEFSSYSEV
jgi:hypothetical protein